MIDALLDALQVPLDKLRIVYVCIETYKSLSVYYFALI